ncbi:MAG: aminotransferase class I/II-fold pyridoxal phosphate-dependent enzyme [Cyclobacteriaceae bacterium]
MSHIYQTNRLGRTVKHHGEDFLHFSGTAYLGMASLPAFEELLVKGIRKYGPNHGSSRNSNVQLPIYRDFENHFAFEAGAPDAMLLSSGYLAGHLAVQTMMMDTDFIWAAPNTHSAILPVGQKTASDMDFDGWVWQCKKRAESLIGQRILFLSNAVNPLKPEIHDFKWIKELPSTNQYYLLIDDSHAFGVLGPSIYGTFASWKDLPAKILVVGSLGKALSLPAGIILGDLYLLEKARAHPIYLSSSPPAPAFLEAFISGQDLYLAQKEKLLEHVHWVYHSLKNSDEFVCLDNFPVITFAQAQWVDELHRQNMILSSFPYPGPQDPPVNRIIISAYHHREDLVYLVDRLLKLNPN